MSCSFSTNQSQHSDSSMLFASSRCWSIRIDLLAAFFFTCAERTNCAVRRKKKRTQSQISIKATIIHRVYSSQMKWNGMKRWRVKNAKPMKIRNRWARIKMMLKRLPLARLSESVREWEWLALCEQDKWKSSANNNILISLRPLNWLCQI